MKKFLSILGMAALLLACNKGGDDPQPLPDPVNKEYSVSVEVKNSPEIPLPGGKTDRLTRVDMASSRTGLAVFANAGVIGFDYHVNAQAKVSAGTEYVVDGVGTFTVLSVKDDAIQISFTPEGTAVAIAEISGQIVPVPDATALLNDACRGWTVSETWISIKGDDISADLGIAKKFNGCNINEISKYAIDKGVNIEEQPASYTVEKLVLTESGKFAVIFAGEDPYYGDYTLTESSFSYDFEYYDEDDPIIAGQASGSFKILSSGKGRLAVTGNMSDKNGKSYSAEVIFFLAPEK